MNEQKSSLLAEALNSYRKGLSRPFMHSRNVERIYDTMQVLAMAQRLSEEEIRTLGIAKDFRERGLQEARLGNLQPAITLISEARKIYESKRLSNEAASCAETYQTAAESYIQFKSREYEAAMLSMKISLRSCEILSSEYGYPLEMRRIHLARNIARIQADADEPGIALRISAGLLQYIGGKEGAWPFPYVGQGHRDLLKNDAALWILDQVLLEAIRLLQPGSCAVIEQLPAVVEARNLLLSGSPEFQRAAHCLSAYIGYAQDYCDIFLEKAITFFETGAQSFELSWREIESKLLSLTK